MARVLGVFSQPLPHTLEQRQVREAVAGWLPAGSPWRERLIAACGNTGISTRHLLLPLGQAREARSFTQRNRIYAEAMVELGHAAVRRALQAGAWEPERFHTLITVSCTGVMIPSADVHIMDRLGFLPSVRRLPITELGCVGGAVALSRGAEIVDAHARSPMLLGALSRADLALVLAAEFSSLNFQPADLTPANVVAAELFGDAVVALVLGPGEGAARIPDWLPPRVVATRSHVVRGTADRLGFELRSSGFHIVLSEDVPFLIRDLLRGLVGGFLDDLGWKLADVDRWAIHPGGEKVIGACLGALGLPPDRGEASRGVLREWGNASSAGVLLVLERLGREAREGDRGLVIGLGPGFSVELVALEWS